ncbi:MAG: hypothetical protein RR246_04175 [Clostridia bacterium]
MNLTESKLSVGFFAVKNSLKKQCMQKPSNAIDSFGETIYIIVCQW